MKTWTFNSWFKYSNELSNYLQNSPMSTRFWSPTFTITMLNQWGTKLQNLLSHSFFPSHASFIFLLFVTSTLYGGNHALFQFSMLIFNVLFANCWFAWIFALQDLTRWFFNSIPSLVAKMRANWDFAHHEHLFDIL